ncbi:hypothetical protein M885DRAFT_517240 [Pelagophyceae sp. CCMP2097]|nr:hypothetical protein M885DRAFT_517240 [Pelagophyceae sp. CCMP2097]|mmetsp:Transcript_14012/g.46747  ORF Transcript_14012/g.46747 Transcript_14012/m.46747 type:complete len:116 (+) Transcript_14012:84-431(+)
MSPVTRTGARTIEGISTSCLVAGFGDYVAVSLTQFDAVGTVLHVQRNGEGKLDISVKMGQREEPHLFVLATQIAQSLGRVDSRKLVLTIAVKASTLEEMESIRALVDLVEAHRTW